MKTLNQMAKEFNKAYEIEDIPHEPIAMRKAIDLIADECSELYDEVRACEMDIKGVAAEMTDILYLTAERMTALGFDVDALLAEKHRSNLSKVIPLELPQEELTAELKEALKRYPDAEIVCVEGGYVLKCSASKKVIKPMCYSKSVITDEMVGK